MQEAILKRLEVLEEDNKTLRDHLASVQYMVESLQSQIRQHESALNDFAIFKFSIEETQQQNTAIDLEPNNALNPYYQLGKTTVQSMEKKGINFQEIKQTFGVIQDNSDDALIEIGMKVDQVMKTNNNKTPNYDKIPNYEIEPQKFVKQQCSDQYKKPIITQKPLEQIPIIGKSESEVVEESFVDQLKKGQSNIDGNLSKNI